MPSLIVQTGKNKGQRLVLPETEVVVGRDVECAIRLSSADVSRQHCVLRVASGEIYVRDLASQNGTLVNDVPIDEEVRLQPGDVLRIGPLQFQVPSKNDRPPGAIAPVKVTTIQRQDQDGQPATDDDIASWLSGDELPVAQGTAGPGDTTIIPGRPSARSAVETPPQPAKTGSAKTAGVRRAPSPKTDVEVGEPLHSPPAKRSPKSKLPTIAEEAAEIIRRHQESLLQEEQQS